MSSSTSLEDALDRIQSGCQTAADLDVIRQAHLTGQIHVTSGQRGVAVGGDAEGSVIVTGDGNTVTVGGASADALRRALDEIKAELKAQHPTVDPRDADNRRRMLQRVRRTWIDGYLNASLRGAAAQVLDLEERPEAVPDEWGSVVQQPKRSQPALPTGTSVVEAFDRHDSELLILGEPGSGKTTMLLELARVLLDRAGRDEMLPMPIVFPLATWALRRLPLSEWLVDEIKQRYDVPRQIGHAWVTNERVLPLLDGLDEVAAEHRAPCVAAINAYRDRQAIVLPGLAVTCRQADYEALDRQVQLRGAVLVRPLRTEQIDAYLLDAGDQLAGVRQALEADPTLQDMASSPLLLSTMALAYHGMAADALPTAATVDERRRQLFAAYVEAMFNRRAKAARYQPAQTLRWLAWLANALTRQAQTTLYLESLQPNWLPTPITRRAYALIDRLGGAVIVGLVLAALVTVATRDWLAGLVIAWPCALAAGLLGGDRAPHAGLQRAGWPIRPRAALGGLAGGLLGAAAVAALMRDLLPPVAVIEFGLVVGATALGLAYALSSGRPAAASTAARRAAVRGVMGGAAGAAVGCLIGFVVLFILVGSASRITNGIWTTLVRDGPLAAFDLSGPMGTFGGFGLLYGLIIGLLGSAVASLTDQTGTSGSQSATRRSALASDVAAGAFVLGILTAAATAMLSGDPSYAAWGLAGGTLGAFVGGVAGGPSVRARQVALVEPTRWSTAAAVRAGLRGLFFGIVWGTLVVGTMFGFLSWALQMSDDDVLRKLGPDLFGGAQDAVILGASAAAAGGVTTGLLFGAVWGILRGLDVAAVEASPVPGHGLRRSARRSIMTGLGTFAAIAVLATGSVVLGGAIGPLFPDVGTVLGGALLLALPFGVGAALAHGGFACLSHVSLRLVLWRTGALPLDTIGFLDDATERIFLRRAGGGYIFVHRLLQEYFASLRSDAPGGR